jgi:T5SS/PEP-CTERM-associated repeat protein
MKCKQLFVRSLLWAGACCVPLPQAQAQTSTWNPSTSLDNYEDPANWDPPGVPGQLSEVRVDQPGGLTRIQLHANHQNSTLNVFDALVILSLNSHRYSLLAQNQASIVVGGSSGRGEPPTLEVHQGVLVGNHAFVGKGKPGELGALSRFRPGISIQSGASLLLNDVLWVGYGESDISKDRPGLVHIAGTAQSDGVSVYPDSKLGVINGGALRVSNELAVAVGGELRIGKPLGTAHPMSTVTARLVRLAGALTIDYGTLSAETEVHASHDPITVTNGSRVATRVGTIAGFPPQPAHVTISGNDSSWSSSDSMYVGGIETAAQGGGTLSVLDNASVVAGTLIKVWSAGKIELRNGSITAPTILLEGTLCGTGTIDGDITNNGGTIDPGCSVGRLHSTGNYTQDLEGVLKIDIAGSNAGEYDVLRIDGDVSLDGALEIGLSDGLVLDRDITFSVIEANSVTGSFSEVLITSGSSAEVSVTSNGVQIRLSPQTPPILLYVVVILLVILVGAYLFRRRSR